ncbi:MFS transporter [Streptomyces sp. AS02]|uniref:MFS transporter n=1 Tax=Streptomyces sp. AS02 TaxID=2938946 RepID=UPI0020214C7A|nr:MFS transporter [Streptomyces sp. AS02]MCL8014942.1 MFS transporter [Streptomyces sp. AS02]
MPRKYRGTAVTVGAAYAAQGLGYATVVTALPVYKERLSLGDDLVSVLLLGTCVAAAVGSVLADLIAVRWGSRQALCAGLGAQAVALAVMASVPPLVPYVCALTVYGIGLGTVDASVNMQGVLVQKRAGVLLLGRFYAAFTAAAIAGALLMSGFAASGTLATGPLLVAAAVHTTVALTGARRFDQSRAAHRAHDAPAERTPLPRRGIWAVGGLVFAAFVVDSAVSTWSSVYLTYGLETSAAVAPLGYAAYQAAVLVSRLATDSLVRALGNAGTALLSICVGVLGCALVASVRDTTGAIAGFAAAGLATGALVPLAFSAAGELRPARSDEVIARVNLFNYAGALAGAVSLGLVATGPALGTAFVIPALLLLAVTPVARRAGSKRAAPRKTLAPETAD